MLNVKAYAKYAELEPKIWLSELKYQSSTYQLLNVEML